MKLSKKALDGNMETLLLSVIQDNPSYGYQIIQDLNAKAPHLLQTGEGTVYPILHRLEERKLIQSTWKLGDSGRQRRYYRITPQGKQALSKNSQEWTALHQLMSLVLQGKQTT